MKVDFSYSEGKAPNNYQIFSKMPFLEISPKDKRNRFVPCMSIYGANASGKTNIIKALSTYRFIIKSTNIQNCYFPNRLNNKYNTTIFELEIFIGSAKFKHLIEYDHREIKKESLLKDDKIIYEIDNTSRSNERYNFNAVMNEQYNEEKIKNILSVECSEKIENVYLQKRVFMSVIAEHYPGLSEDIGTVFKGYYYHKMIYSSNDIAERMLRLLSDLKKSNEYVKDISDRVSNIVHKFDIDILRIAPTTKHIEIKDKKLKGYYENFPKTIPRYSSFDPDKGTVRRDFIDSYHEDINGQEIIFDMKRDESKGTNILFGLITEMLLAFNAGDILVIDELDNSIHPLILAKIIEMFKSKEYNKNNAQLIFTIHCADILDMDILRVSEVALINKNLKSGSTFKRISDFENVRNTADFRKMYLNGEFSGIPFPYI
jgi:AAA15 family ATPase/GTPase